MHLFASTSLTRTPAKKAAGNFVNRNILNLTGSFISLMKAVGFEFIYSSLYCAGSIAFLPQSLKNAITFSLS